MTVPGVLRIPLRRYEDERGWFCELRRDSALPRPTVQTNLSFSRKGVIRGLHYHERGQDDLGARRKGAVDERLQLSRPPLPKCLLEVWRHDQPRVDLATVQPILEVGDARRVARDHEVARCRQAGDVVAAAGGAFYGGHGSVSRGWVVTGPSAAS